MIKNKIHKIKKKYSKINNPNSDKKIWLYGYHSVKAALENINRKKYQLICTKNALDKLGELAKNLEKLQDKVPAFDLYDAKKIIKNSDVKLYMVDNNNQLSKYLKQNMYGKKIVVAMGAGSISNWIKELPSLMQ